uniref:Uncharacterized protein n=1 Tax=Oryza punctata TaxID=4537 RepID=A0A0E0LX74_ORYPU
MEFGEENSEPYRFLLSNAQTPVRPLRTSEIAAMDTRILSSEDQGHQLINLHIASMCKDLRAETTT